MYVLPVNEMHPVFVVKQEPKEPELVVNQEMNEASKLELVVKQEVNEANELELVEEQELNEANEPELVEEQEVNEANEPELVEEQEVNEPSKPELVVKQEVNEANEPEIVVKQELNDPNCPSNSLFNKNAKKVQHSLISKPIMIQPKGVPPAVKSTMPLSGVRPPIMLRITLVDNVPTLVPMLQPTTNVQQPLTTQPSITGNISLIPRSSVTSLKSSNMPSVSGNQAAFRLQPTVVLSHNQILGNQLLSTSVKSAQIKQSTKMIPIYPVSLTKVAPLTTQPSEKQAPVLQPEIFEQAISQSPMEVDKLEQKQPSLDEILSETQKSLSSENTSALLCQYQPKRFEKITTGDMEKLQEPFQESRSTKANTKWGVKMFQDWSRETTGSEVDFHNISKEDLNEKLKYFYAEAKPKYFESCVKVPYQSNAYNKRSMSNVRAALNRHLKHIDKNFDIVRDPEFRESNTLLNAKWRLLARSGLLPPVRQRESIDLDDLKLICNYVYRASFDPFSFRFRVWFCIAVNFISLGIGFHQHLTLKSFDFKRNDEGREYAVLKYETKNRNTDRKGSAQVMYASSGKDFCPVAALRLMISKTEPDATLLFNRHIKGKIKSKCESIDLEKNLWYCSESLGKAYFTNFMTDICKQLNCSKVYTASSLHVTAIQAKFDPILKCTMCNIQR